jgi:hypothetical protein
MKSMGIVPMNLRKMPQRYWSIVLMYALVGEQIGCWNIIESNIGFPTTTKA